MRAEAFEIRVLARQTTILGIKGNCLPQVLERVVRLRAHGQGNSHYVVRVVAVRRLFERATQMVESGPMVAGVQRHGRRIHPLLHRLRPHWTTGRFPLADAEIQPRTLEQFAFVRVSVEHGTEVAGGGFEVVTLQRPDPVFIERNRFVIPRFLGGGG